MAGLRRAAARVFLVIATAIALVATLIGPAASPAGAAPLLPDLKPVIQPVATAVQGVYTSTVRPPLVQLTGNTVVPYLDGILAALGQADYVAEVWSGGNRIYNAGATVGIPHEIDYDAARPGPEFIMMILPTSTGAAFQVALDIRAVPGLTIPSNVQVDAVAEVAPGQFVRVGYNAAGRAAPDTWQASATIYPSQITGNITTIGGGALTTVVELFNGQGQYGMILNATLTPMPAKTDFAAAFGGNQMAVINAPGSALDATLLLPGEGDAAKVIRARTSALSTGTVMGYPGSVGVRLSSVEGRPEITYNGAGRLANAIVEFYQYGPGTMALRAELSDVPPVIQLTQETPTSIVVSAPERIGQTRLFAGLGRHDNSPVLTDTTFDHVGVELHADRTTRLNAQVNGITYISASWAPGYRVHLNHDAGPLRVFGRSPEFDADATFNNLPANVIIKVDPVVGSVDYQGDAVIANANFLMTRRDSGVIFGRVKQIIGTLTNIPTILNLRSTPTDGGSTITFDTGGQSLGMLEIELHSGMRERLPDGQEGVKMWDMSDHYGAHVRLSNVKRATFSSAGGSCVLTQTGGSFTPRIDTCTSRIVANVMKTAGSQIWFDFRQPKKNADGSNKSEYDIIKMHANNVPADVFAEITSKTNHYTFLGIPTIGPAELRAGYIGRDAAGNLVSPAGSSFNLDMVLVGDGASIAGRIAPLPTTASLCWTPLDNRCSGSPMTTNQGSVAMLVGNRVVADVDICDKAAKCVEVDNVSFKTLRFSSNVGGSDWDNIYIDTDFKALTGEVRTPDVRVSFPNGFWAENRGVQYVGHSPFRPDPSGRLSCPPNTGVWVKVIGFNVNMATILCDRARIAGPGHHEYPTPPAAD